MQSYALPNPPPVWYSGRMKKPQKHPVWLIVFGMALSTYGLYAGGRRQADTPAARVTGEIQPLDIKSNAFFWMLRPWKEGTMATIDGRGRFAELSFEKNNRIKIKPLIRFPGASLDQVLITWPGANLLYAQSAGKMVFLADLGTGRSKAFAPLLSWVHYNVQPALLDPQEGLFLFVYRDHDDRTIHRTILYNYKTDTVVREEDLDLYMEYSLDGEWLFARSMVKKGETYEGRVLLKEMFLYNWKTKEIRRNKLTETFTALDMVGVDFENGHSLSLQKRYIIGTSRQMGKKVKLNWSEDYEDVTVLPLDYLLPQGKRFTTFFLSDDGGRVSSDLFSIFISSLNFL